MSIPRLDKKEDALVGNRAFQEILARISAGAAGRDSDPSFPGDPFRRLALAGVLAMPVPDPVGEHGRRASFIDEWRVLRAVARSDGSVGRILDGHFNGVERLSLLAPEPLRSSELEAVAAGRLFLGVWGADPIGGEGEPARLVEGRDGATLSGVKTFCSGSTGLDRALVLARKDVQGPPVLA
jgi:alkylation response protein AidB-like acyl-CoA dehydrogenase